MKAGGVRGHRRDRVVGRRAREGQDVGDGVDADPVAGAELVAEDSHRERIEQQVSELRDDGLDATFVVRTSTSGHAAKAIAEIAREVGADLIVIGTHGYGRVAGFLLGSVTQALLKTSVCPVLAITTGDGTDSAEPVRETEAVT